jgi:GMP synthase-like glutamine amidotransferase
MLLFIRKSGADIILRMSKTAKVALIDNSIDPDVYRPVEHWSPFLNCVWESFTARDHKFPRWTDGFTHVILTGSEASILEMAPWALEEAEWIREGLDRGLAFLGSCWGHQLLAYVLSGPGHVRRCSRPEIGWIPIRVVAPGGPLGDPGTAYSFSLHFDEAVEMGPRFEVLAETDVCRIQAFQSRDGRILGLQIHPEINPRQGRRLLADLIRKGFAGADRMAEALKSQPRDSGLAARIVADFLEAGSYAAAIDFP